MLGSVACYSLCFIINMGVGPSHPLVLCQGGVLHISGGKCVNPWVFISIMCGCLSKEQVGLSNFSTELVRHSFIDENGYF